MLRVFFTGAFRKPRELNWLIGVTMFILAMAEGFAGYSLPDDLLSGTGLRTFQGIVLSIPIVGTYLSYFIFGGEYPGRHLHHPALHRAHPADPGPADRADLRTPAAGLLPEHTQYPEAGHRNDNVVGRPMIPVYAAKSIGLFTMLFGLLAVLAAAVQINPIWTFGPYEPQQATSGSQPDWYLGWLEGGLRLMPNWTTDFLGHTIAWNVFVPGAVMPLLLFAALYAYPFLEQWATGNREERHLLDRPRNQPTRTALGAAGITFFAVLTFAGGDDVHTLIFRLDIINLVWALRVLLFALPALVFLATRRICMELQRADWRAVLFGRDTGELIELPGGGYRIAVAHLDAAERYKLTAHDNGPPPPPRPRGLVPRRWALWIVRRSLAAWDRNHRVRKPTPLEYNVAHRGIWDYHRRPPKRHRRRPLHVDGDARNENETQQPRDPARARETSTAHEAPASESRADKPPIL